MHLDHDDRTLLELATIGAAIALGKLLLGGEKITLRLLFGRVIVGAGLSLAAATALAMIPQLSPLTLVGIGSAFGIAGQALLEKLIQRWLGAPRVSDE
jgi:hypothetical protein